MWHIYCRRSSLHSLLFVLSPRWVDCAQRWLKTPICEHACSSSHQEVEAISPPFWSGLDLTCFDQWTVAKVTLGQLWVSLL